MHRLIVVAAAVIAASAISWFAALSYADWKREASLARWQTEWSEKCKVMKDIILMRISDPGSELQTGRVVGTDDRNWERCRRVGVITAQDEQAAYVERQRRQQERLMRIDLKLPPPR